MKKIFLLSAIVGLMFASCNSEDSPVGTPDLSTKNVPISIKVSSDNEFTTLRSVSPEEAGIKSLMYLVYKESDDSFVKYKSIESGDLSVVNDTLPEGRYKVILFGSEIPNMNTVPGYPAFLDNEVFPGANKSFTSAAYILRTSAYEHYVKVLTMDLAADANTQSIVLDRVGAKLEIVPLDVASVPEDVYRIEFCIDGLSYQWYNFSTGETSPMWDASYMNSTISTFGRSYSREDLLKVNAENPIAISVFPTKSPLLQPTPNGDTVRPILVKFYKVGEGNSWTQIIKSEYNLERNKVLRLTGNLFPTNPTVNGNITVDTNWDSEIVEQGFDK